jgi:hypothetical protein
MLSPMALKNYNLFNALAFTLVFLLIFEATNICQSEEDTHIETPQWLIFTISLMLGAIAGFDRQPLTNPIRR